MDSKTTNIQWLDSLRALALLGVMVLVCSFGIIFVLRKVSLGKYISG